MVAAWDVLCFSSEFWWGSAGIVVARASPMMLLVIGWGDFPAGVAFCMCGRSEVELGDFLPLIVRFQ